MIQVALNAIFGAALLMFAARAAGRGWPFLRSGWAAIQTQASRPDYRQNVVRRRAIGQGGVFLLGGLLWLGAALLAFAAGIYLSWLALAIIYGGNN
jgi:hypothetical protein